MNLVDKFKQKLTEGMDTLGYLGEGVRQTYGTPEVKRNVSQFGRQTMNKIADINRKVETTSPILGKGGVLDVMSKKTVSVPAAFFEKAAMDVTGKNASNYKPIYWKPEYDTLSGLGTLGQDVAKNMLATGSYAMNTANPLFAAKTAGFGAAVGAGGNLLFGERNLPSTIKAATEGSKYGLETSATQMFTNGVVNKLANKVKWLKPITEQGIESTLPKGVNFGEWAKGAGKTLLKREIKATLLETPIEGITYGFTDRKKGQKLMDSIAEQTYQNLIYNTAFAGANTVWDSRTIAPILKKSFDQSIANYQALPKEIREGGFINPKGVDIKGDQTLYRGEGSDLQKAVRQSGVDQSLGTGKYYSLTEQGAVPYGKTKAEKVATGNTLDVSKQEDLQNLVNTAIEKYPNVKPEEAISKVAKDMGYDSISDGLNINILGGKPLELPAPRGFFETVGGVKTKTTGLIDQVKSGLKEKLGGIESKIYGTATPTKSEIGTGDKQGAGLIADSLRKVEATISGKVGEGLQSENPVVRNFSRTLQGFSGGLGKSREVIERTGEFRGSVDYGNKLAYDTQQYVAGLVGKDAKSLERIHSVMDPEISKTKLSYNDLNPNEKQATDFLKSVSDYINDTNYTNGFISKEQWQKNRGGKYIARAYSEYDFPPEVADFIKQNNLKLDENPFVKRGEITDWKMENIIKDPAYLMSKRLQQTVFNDELSRMFKWLGNTDMVSSTKKPGFVQLSDHRAYGELAGKWVRKDILDDIRGLQFSNVYAQKAYDLLNAYNKNPIRQTQKQLMTVFNPGVITGNKAGAYVFAGFNGIDPVTFAKNQMAASKIVDNNGELYRRMIKDGLVGTDESKADITKFAQMLQNGYKDPNLVQKAIQAIRTDYGKSDDIAKVAAMKTWLDRGYAYEEAARRVYNGFQNYRTVGWLYELGAKSPIFGNPFVRFQADLQRIMKNAVVNNPVGTLGIIGAWKLMTDAGSILSGETPEDRKTRESRIGSPRVPFTNISMAVQTPWGEVNAARLTGIAAYTPVGGASVGSDLSRMAPFQNPLDARNLGASPDIGPLLAMAVDKDFRGKSIADPNQNKFSPSTLTPQEQMANRGKFLARSYVPFLSNVQDTASALKNEPNYYGQTRTPAQGVARLAGLKVEQFGPKEAQATRDKEMYYQEKANSQKETMIKSITKDFLTGKIDEKTYNARVSNIQKQDKPTSYEPSSMEGIRRLPNGNFGVLINTGSGTQLREYPTAIKAEYAKIKNDIVISGEAQEYKGKYLYPVTNDMGDTVVKDIDLKFTQKPPRLTGNMDMDKELLGDYKSKVNSRINDVMKLYEVGKITREQASKEIRSLKKINEVITKYTAKPKKAKKIKIKPMKKIKVKTYKIPKVGKFKPKVVKYTKS